MDTLVAKLRLDLVICPETMRGFRWWLAAKILGVAAMVFGGKLIVGIQPEFVIGTISPKGGER